jgi:hypothetical protein
LQSFLALIDEEYDSLDSIGGHWTRRRRMNSTDIARGLEAIAEVGTEAGAEAGTTAELVIEGILIPILAVPGVIG